MSDIVCKKGDGSSLTIPGADVEQLKQSLKGQLLTPGDDQYDDSRTIWNAMINRRPALIARCADAADVSNAVQFASKNQLLTSIQGGGHNIAGNAVCEGGFMIDLSGMKKVTVNTSARRVQVEPGATLGDVDHETQAFGMATPTGINSTTGIAGLTLGGGFGWLSRKHGMTVDALRSADVVTADGKMIHASENENTDLFWAVRGGGGNFGVVTQFEYELYPVGPEVLSGLIVFSQKEAVSVLKQYREHLKNASEETSIWVVLRKAPPLPFLPEEVHGTDILALALCHIGDPAVGEEFIAPLRSFGTVLGEHVGVQPFKDWQQAFDPLLTPGARNYWKSHNFVDLPDDLLDVVVKYAGNLPSDQSEIFIGALGGAINRVAPDATAYSHRDANFVMNVHGRWEELSDDDKVINWSREFIKASESFATGGVYINFITDDEADRISSAYGVNFDRLAQVKQKYDPNNLFRMNHNIAPKG